MKLLNKTFRIYLLCSAGVLTVAAPVFYWTMERLYIEDTDETLSLYKKEFEHYYLPDLKQSEIATYNRYNRNIKIERSETLPASDTIFYRNYLDTLDDENEPYRVLQSPVIIENEPYTLVVRISLVESEDLIKSIALVFFALILLLLSVLVFFINRLSKKIWQSFRRSLEKLKAFDLTDGKGVVLEETDIEEFEEMNRSLRKLIDENISAYNQQKTFIENASHELQTPLSVIKSKLDLLVQNKDLTSEQFEIVNAVERALSRVSRINKNLLLLAKIENNQFADKESMELTEAINETLELLTDYAQAKGIAVFKNLSEKCLVVCNKTLLEILISNLIINAIVHNVEGGKIEVSFSGGTLRVYNTGQTALNEKKIFDRFVVLSSRTAGSGLGLSIVKEICYRYGWRAGYFFEKKLHCFWIGFPKF